MEEDPVITFSEWLALSRRSNCLKKQETSRTTLVWLSLTDFQNAESWSSNLAEEVFASSIYRFSWLQRGGQHCHTSSTGKADKEPAFNTTPQRTNLKTFPNYYIVKKLSLNLPHHLQQKLLTVISPHCCPSIPVGRHFDPNMSRNKKEQEVFL